MCQASLRTRAHAHTYHTTYYTTQVADFGLAVRMDHLETHVSGLFQGTMTHMAPEVLLKGTCSKASDVYA